MGYTPALVESKLECPVEMRVIFLRIDAIDKSKFRDNGVESWSWERVAEESAPTDLKSDIFLF